MKSFTSKFNNPKEKNNKIRDDKNSTIGLSRHKPAFNTHSLSHAVERAINDEIFLNSALETIKRAKFPASSLRRKDEKRRNEGKRRVI